MQTSTRPFHPTRWLTPLRATLLYAALAALWIVASGYLLSLTTADAALLAHFEQLKGLAFVVATSIPLYLLLRFHAARSVRLNEAAEQFPGKPRFGAIFLALALIAPLIGFGIVRLYGPHIEQETFDNLHSIAELKTKQIENWVSERIGDAKTLSESKGFIIAVADLQHDGSAKHAEVVRNHLELPIKIFDYGSVVLLDATGRPLVSLGKPHLLNDATLQQLHEALTIGKVQHGPWRSDSGGEQHMDFIAPLTLDADGQSKPIGAVLLHVDPLRFLQPYIDSWPGVSTSAETLLVRQQGDRLDYLNEPQRRAGKNIVPPVSPVSPVSPTDSALPAAIALHAGHSGNVSGVDYRGVPVLAAYRPVKGTDWYLVAKIDRDEAFASVRALAIWISLVVFIAAASIGVTVLLLWRQQQQANQLKLQLNTSALVRQSEARYRAATESVVDAIVNADSAGNIISWNRAAARLFGHTEAEALGQPLTLLIPAPLQHRCVDGLTRLRTGGTPHVIGKTVELTARHKNGTEFPVELSLARWQTDEGVFYTGILRDIAERKRADLLLRRQKDLYNMLSQTNQMIVRCDSPEYLFENTCRVAVEQGGFRFAWIGQYEAKSNQVKPVARFGEDHGYIDKVHGSVAANEVDQRRLASDVMRSGTYIIINDFLADSTVTPWLDVAASAGVGSAGAFPIRHGDKVVGALSLYAAEPGFFSADVLSTLSEMASDITFALDNLDRSAAMAAAAQVVGASPVVVYRLVPEDGGRIEYISENVSRWGYTAAEILSGAVNYQHIVHADDMVLLSAERERHAREGHDNFTQIGRIVTATGDTLWVEVHVHIERNADGQVLCYEGTATDVSEREQINATLAQRNVLIETILEHAPIGFAVNTMDDGKVLFVGHNFESFYGLPKGGLSEVSDFFDKVYLDPDLRERLRTRVMEDINSGDLTRMHWDNIEFKGLDGKKRVVNAMNIPLPEQNLTISAVQDVSAQFEAQATLRAAEEQFRGLVEQAIAGIYIMQNGHLVYVNQRCAEIFGYATAEALRGVDPLTLVVESDRAKTLEHMQQLADGTVQHMAFEFTATRQDGKMMTIGLHGARATHCGRHATIGLLQDISEKKRDEEQIARYVKQLEGAVMRTVEVATTLSEMRDPYTAGHEKRVAQIAVAIGAEMGYNGQRQEGLRVAGYLHDIGKITIPTEILSKPGRLSTIELELIKGHARASYEVLRNVEFPWPVAEIALQHHERMDGTGYPQGLKGEAILPEARIMAVADVIEAMASHRPYRAGLGIEAAMQEISRGRGTAYDVAVADACLRLFREKGYQIPA